MNNFLGRLLRSIGDYFRRLNASGENSCGRCGVCHHVCDLMKKKKNSAGRED